MDTAKEQKYFEPGERTISEIVHDLSKPVADRHIQYKKQGGQQLAFISWYHRCKYLDFFAPGWTYEIRDVKSVAGKLIMIVRISIPTANGIIFREATGQEDETKDTYGDSSSNAEAMALSRASAKFGLGLYLYEK